MNDQKVPTNPGFEEAMRRPLMDVLFRRRTHRVSRGVKLLKAGSMTYTSAQKPHPLSKLEEAVLIAAIGHTGLTMPDRQFQDPQTGDFIMAKPNLTMDGRTAGSPDNAQGTSFFMLNDEGTFFIKKLAYKPGPFDPATLLQRADQAKVKILDKRIDTDDRDFPAYLDSNRFLSNLAGTTVFFPVVDLSHQYINGMMYLLTQPKGHRPTIVDDRNFYRLAGVRKWVKNGFLNKDIKVPLGGIGFRGLRRDGIGLGFGLRRLGDGRLGLGDLGFVGLGFFRLGLPGLGRDGLGRDACRGLPILASRPSRPSILGRSSNSKWGLRKTS